MKIQSLENHQHESVHLKLNTDPSDTLENDEKNEEHNTKLEKKVITLLSYQDPNTKEIWNGLGVSQRRFTAWLNYTLEIVPKECMISSSEITDISPLDRDHLRRTWSEGRLICDRTGNLTVYKSDSIANGESDNSKCQLKGTKNKRGGFQDLLHLYAERFQGILQDEQEETNLFLISWLYHEYGINETQQLLASNFQDRNETEQLQILQHFLDWFRSSFPYFYDRCDSCGASFKEDPKDDDEDEGTFLGYVFPSKEELKGNAGRTELYQCHKCQAYTRFPRFNKVQAVLNLKRGRCGEYSMLIYRMLGAAGHEVRWVVDWSDHVWNEILLNKKKWVHLDPCEAAVDTPLLYQDWGKQQTYILGFSSPPLGDKVSKHSVLKYPVVEDLTKKYTSDTQNTIDERREESPREFAKTLAKNTGILREYVSKASSS
eukprot:CAMPEP_0194202138 /NCGR_PEP_ID=MMETSP0156-20130528/2244_1 /TAXON_ID=33649 /ORGANISM="Thalassionema nitzschioides, Strain L26-B" /LENGTH=430 /DNA_ID=CAMNT_0038927543 /DNA_START=324 /DNA_END=1616 /DNA_ORIENTATION=-